MERVSAALQQMAADRTELAELRRALTDSDARVNRLHRSLTDQLDRLHAQRQVDDRSESLSYRNQRPSMVTFNGFHALYCAIGLEN